MQRRIAVVAPAFVGDVVGPQIPFLQAMAKNAARPRCFDCQRMFGPAVAIEDDIRDPVFGDVVGEPVRIGADRP
jgi:hypothetical protein